MTDTEKKLFKDWFDEEAAERLASQISIVFEGFDRKTFVNLATKNLKDLEMMARVTQFSDAMAACLPEDKEKALEILTKSLPEVLPGTGQVTDGWLQWPLGKFIADHGLPYFETSMSAMLELTQRFSSEFAVRPFLEQNQDQTLHRLLEYTSHPSAHVRRWCSEGTRPLLPWGKKLTSLMKDPSPVWPVLEALKDDPEKYVQKSVANHLNDISKTHPDLVIDRCKEWMKNAAPQRIWIVRHGLRTLIKNGHPEALALLGFAPPKQLKANLKLHPASIETGQSTELQLSLQNQSTHAQDLLIDYAVTYVRKQAGTGRKVFKWTTLRLEGGEKRALNKKHPMRITSVRALYPGTHTVEILVNGQSMCEGKFILI